MNPENPEATTATTTATAGPAPAGSPRLVTFIAVNRAAKALEFYQQAFGAQVVQRFDGPDGTVMHAELDLAGGRIQLSDPIPAIGIVPPPEQGNAFTITVWSPDVDEVYQRAVSLGATVISPVEDAFSGDRMGVLRCPYGVRWCIARHDRDVPAEEIDRIAREWLAGRAD